MKPIKKYFAALLSVALVLPALMAFPASAATVVPLANQTIAYSGYNYKATIPYTDLITAAGSIQTITLLPGSGSFPAGTVVKEVAFNLTTSFTNSTANNTNLLLYLGTDAGNTNTFFSGIDLDGRSLQAGGTQFYGATNYVYAIAGDTNEIVAVFKQVGGTPALSTVTKGQVEIYLRTVNLNRLENE
jgi:hypothetical protein